jgi:hypothetical protein
MTEEITFVSLCSKHVWKTLLNMMREMCKIKKIRITEVLDFESRPEFEITRKHNISETGSVSV